MKNLQRFLLSIATLICSFQTQAQNTTLPHDTCLDKKFSVVFYVIQDSVNSLPNNPLGNSANYLPTYSLTAIINILNTAFARICVSFENCKTVIIPNYSYNKWNYEVTDSVITANWYSEKTINIYIPAKTIQNASTTDPDCWTPVYAVTAPAPPKDYLVLFKAPPGPTYGFQSALLHAMGHFFGLRHTFAETSIFPVLANGPSTELVNDLFNCPVLPAVVHGDGFCDTDADPYPTGYNTFVGPCEFDQGMGVTDANGNFYTPPIDNYMSIYKCRCRFTQQQYNFMARFILTKRLYLH